MNRWFINFYLGTDVDAHDAVLIGRVDTQAWIDDHKITLTDEQEVVSQVASGENYNKWRAVFGCPIALYLEQYRVIDFTRHLDAGGNYRPRNGLIAHRLKEYIGLYFGSR